MGLPLTVFAPPPPHTTLQGCGYGAALAQFHVAGLAVASPQAYALVSMAALLAANCKVPLTAILLMFEYTQDFRIILPLMGCVGVASWVANIAEEKPRAPKQEAGGAKQEGSEGSEGAEQEEEQKGGITRVIDDVALSQALVEDAAIERALQKLQVSVAMASDYLTLPADSGVDEAGSLLVASGARCAIVVDANNGVVGILTHEAVQRALRGGPSKAVSAARACEQDGGGFSQEEGQKNFVYPDSTLAEALTIMNSLGVRQLPVLPRPEPSAAAVAVGAASNGKGKGGAAVAVQVAVQPVGVVEAEARLRSLPSQPTSAALSASPVGGDAVPRPLAHSFLLLCPPRQALSLACSVELTRLAIRRAQRQGAAGGGRGGGGGGASSHGGGHAGSSNGNGNGSGCPPVLGGGGGVAGGQTASWAVTAAIERMLRRPLLPPPAAAPQ